MSCIILDTSSLCSTSRYALGSSKRYRSAFCDRQCAIATLCSSPPDSWSSCFVNSGLMFSGFMSCASYFAIASVSTAITSSSLPWRYCGL